MVKYRYEIAVLDNVIDVLIRGRDHAGGSRVVALAEKNLREFLRRVHRDGLRIISILPIEGKMMYTLEEAIHTKK